MRTIRELRLRAINQSLFTPTTLKAAIQRLGFVQADPICAPARAQDLILRHRVRNYRVGDLDRKYTALDIEEGVLYAYGFLERALYELRYPPAPKRLRQIQARVLEIVSACDETHPRDLEAHLGRKRALNAWGGFSKATTLVLESLRARGLLRIKRREDGIRIYERARAFEAGHSKSERLMGIVMATTKILGPISESSLQDALRPTRRKMGDTRTVVSDLCRSGQLERTRLDGVSYLCPAGESTSTEDQSVVRFLAPFDPVVWDRRRFEHLWGWAYRFEAYTPPAYRVRGYYAMPLLWRQQVIGWVNALTVNGSLAIEPGFINSAPKDRAFGGAFEAEVEELKIFLRNRRAESR